ncbi:MAG: 16S rRNA (cytidine(1402)-2'-O)-methyltransferase [Parachlamydiaceae bacterium]
MLYIVATPIGNLQDMTFRAIETLKRSDYILCEDTRHSINLLNFYDIKKPLVSFHKFNESEKQADILQDLLQGRILSLISDAGTPGISDPGMQLIHACIEAQIPVTPIPGACAAITALCSSGLDTTRFQFNGFLPRKAGELRRSLQEILAYTGTTICYESPNRLVDVIECLQELAPERPLVVARELTKKFEEVVRGVPAELLMKWKDATIKGEIVLLISGNTTVAQVDWESLTPQEHVELLQKEYGISRQEAIVNAAKLRGVSKRDVYNAVHRTENEF